MNILKIGVISLGLLFAPLSSFAATSPTQTIPQVEVCATPDVMINTAPEDAQLVAHLPSAEAHEFITRLAELAGETPPDLDYDSIYLWSPYNGVPTFTIFFFKDNCNLNKRITINGELLNATVQSLGTENRDNDI